MADVGGDSILYQLLRDVSNIGFLPILFLAVGAVISFIAMGITGFGPAIVFHVWWQVLVYFWPVLSSSEGAAGDKNPVIDGVMLLAVNSIFSIVSLYFKSRNEVKWELFWYMFIPKTTCFCLGTELLIHAPPRLLKVTLGAVFTILGIWLAGMEGNRAGLSRWFRRVGCLSSGTLLDSLFPLTSLGTSASQLSWKLKVGAAISGGASGLLNGMFGAPGPPLMIFFVVAGFDKGEIRGTTTACHFWSLPIRLTYFFIYKRRFDITKWVQMVVVIVFGYLGLQLGDRLFRKINTQTVQWVTLTLLFGACVLMMEIPLPLTLLLFSSLASALFALLLHRRKTLTLSSTDSNV